MLWICESGPATFQEIVSQTDSEAPPEGVVTFLFDVLHLEGEDLLDAPLAERVARLNAIAPLLRIRPRGRGEDAADPAGRRGLRRNDVLGTYT